MASTARQRLIAFWDRAIADFVDGGPAVPTELDSWFRSYRGAGDGKVQLDALPEPYLGPLQGHPKMVFLALNPGRAHPFQERTGRFAGRIRELGSYSAWAASWPYIDGDWEIQTKRPNKHHRTRMAFMKRWLHDAGDPVTPENAVAFELYPWHSIRKTASMKPDPELIRHYVWEPIAELKAPVFAFGADWFPMLEKGLKLRVIDRLGAGGRSYGSTVASRSVAVFEDRSGMHVIAEKHSGGAGPPRADEVERLRGALANVIH